MFCPNCGKENAAGDRFCAECGEALVDNQGGWNGIDTEKAALAAKSALKGLDGRGAQALGWLRAHKKLLILVAAAAVAVIAFAVIGNHLYNPQRVAERYFEAIVEADADSAYDCLDITESEFTGRDDFAVYWAESFTPLDIYNYEVEETTDAYDDDPIERTFRDFNVCTKMGSGVLHIRCEDRGFARLTPMINAVFTGYNEVLPTEETDVAIREIGAMVSDIQKIGDLAIDKWKKD